MATKLNEATDKQLVAAYVKLRDELAVAEAAYKESISPKKGNMEKIEAEFLRRLIERDAESIRTESGTAYKSSRISVTTADWDAFFHQYVMPNGAWELIERRPSKEAVKQFKAEHGDIPPGLNWREENVVGFRRA